MKLVVAQSIVGEALDRRHVNGPTERAGHAEAHIIEHDEQDIRRAGGALTSNRGGGVALRASNSVMGGRFGSGIGSIVRSNLSAAWTGTAPTTSTADSPISGMVQMICLARRFTISLPFPSS